MDRATDAVWESLDQQIGHEHEERAPKDMETSPGALDQIDALLATGATDPQPESGEDAGQGAGQGAEEVESADDVEDAGTAEAAGDEHGELEPEEVEAVIDYDLQIPMPYGMEPMKLGELKDIAAANHVTTERLQRRETEIQESLRDLEEVAGAVQLDPRTKSALDAQKQARLTREFGRMMEAIPAWEDNTVYAKDNKLMGALATEYGFSEREYGAIGDHRLIRVVRDYALMKRRLSGESTRVEPKPKEVRKARKQAPRAVRESSAKKQDTMIKEAAASKDPAVKMSAINSLLR